MSKAFRNNHYVPIWYQRRFLPPGYDQLFYRDLKPDTFRDPRGISHRDKDVKRLGFRKGFARRDLYTTHFGPEVSTQIEQEFLGEIDSRGHVAVDYFASFVHPWDGANHFEDMVLYMSTQKLRTPKGLGWLDEAANARGLSPLQLMVDFRGLFCAIWTECVWSIASAEQSTTKFIVSDHPVTAYNRKCGPRSPRCRNYQDPDIRLHATHTLFPLSFDKILILTNLSWLRNPYQSETDMRPNPVFFRDALFNTRYSNATHAH